MKQRTSILLFGLGIFLGMLVLTGSTAQPAQAASTYQDNPCAGLTPEKIRAGGVTVLQCKLHCQGILPAGDPNTWSDEELWSCINQSGGQPDDQPVEELPPTTPPDQTDLDSACAGMTPEDFYSDSQEITECRVLCSEAYWQSEEELWACIEYYGGDQPVEEVPDVPLIPPDDQTDTGEPASLGPLATTPLVPLAGALIGTVIGWLVSVAATSGNVLKTLVTPTLRSAQPPAIAGIPPMSNMNEQGLYWSERPWDEAGPGYVSREEYERTKDFLAKGYKWTNGGWQTPQEIQQSDQWQQNNRAVTAGEDAEWQAEMERERQALEQNKAELKKTADELQATSNMLDLNHSLETINQDLLKENIYVFNPYQGDPTLIGHGVVMTKNLAWDYSVGLVTGSNGLTCQGYVDQTFEAVKAIVRDQYGPGAKVESIKFGEKSTVDPRKGWVDPGAWKDWCDSFIEDNHNLIKVILPDGSEWAVDFHQHNTGNKPPILRPWPEAKKVWKPYLGDHEFIESIMGQ